jgi:hypothetical protein
MTTTKIPYWTMSKVDQKRELEFNLRVFLSFAASDITPHERFFLAETIALTNRGQYELARAAMSDVYRDASMFAHEVMDPETVAKATPPNLNRALQYLESTTVREYPVFR